MAAPVFAPDIRTRDALLAHPGIKEIFQKGSRLDLAVLSGGELSPFSTISEYYLLQHDELASLQSASAVGDVWQALWAMFCAALLTLKAMLLIISSTTGLLYLTPASWAMSVRWFWSLVAGKNMMRSKGPCNC